MKDEVCEFCFNKNPSANTCLDSDRLGWQPIDESGFCKRFTRGIDEDEEVNDDQAGEG